MSFINKIRTASAAALIAISLTAARLPAGDAELVSSNELMEAYAAVDGIRLVAAKDTPGSVYTEDYGPSQVVEIIRPDGGPITVGRLSTSCSCLRATLPKRSFAQGERALIEVRNIKPTPKGGALFALFVQLTSPHQAALQYEIYVQSTRDSTSPATGASTAAPAAGKKTSQAKKPAPASRRASGAVSAGGEIKPPALKYEDMQAHAPKPRDDSPDELRHHATMPE